MSGSLASAMIMGGTSVSPRGIVPPAPDDVTSWVEFYSAAPDISLRNLRNSAAPFTAVGGPLQGAYARFDGTASTSIDAVGEVEVPVMAALALVRTVGAPTATHRIFSNLGSGGSSWYVVASGNMAFAATYEGGGATASTSGALMGSAWDDWKLVAVRVSGANRRQDILSLGTFAESVLPAAHIATGAGASTPWRIGTNRATTPATPGAIDVAAITFWRGRTPTTAELIANGAMMKARALSKAGINVALLTTA